MNRWLLIGSMMGLMAVGSGCQSLGSRGDCSTCPSTPGMHVGNYGGGGQCQSGQCNSGQCQSGQCNSGQRGGLLGKVRGRMGGDQCGHGRTGCQAGPLGWQQGGLDYSSHLNPGVLGHQAGAAVANQPFAPGMPSAQVAYPYYTHRGPRDFLMANPPSIGP